MGHQPDRLAVGEQASKGLELGTVGGDLVKLRIASIGEIDDDQAELTQAQPVGLGRERPGTQPPAGRGLGRAGTLTLAPQERGGRVQ